MQTTTTEKPIFPSSFLTFPIDCIQFILGRLQQNQDSHPAAIAPPPPPQVTKPDTILYPCYAAWCDRTKKNRLTKDLDIQAMRNSREEMAKLAILPGGVIEETIQVESEGRELRLVILRPEDAAVDEVLPIVIYYHGGGFIFCSKNTHGKLIRQLCVKANVMIVFPEYSLAPEFQFPTAHEESYATLTWVLSNYAKIHGDIGRLAVCGDSSGGNLAAAVPLMARDRGLPADTIKTQILLYPQLDHEQDYHSFLEYGDGEFGLSATDSKYFNGFYQCPKGEEGYTYRYPIHTPKEDLKGLPAALVVSVEADCLRDEAEIYAGMLLKAGVETTCIRRLHAPHAFMSLPYETPAYFETMDLVVHHLKRIFDKC